MMDADEKDIFRYLRRAPGNSAPANSIGRHAGGKGKFRESPDWAKPVLLRMVERGILEVDFTGMYRLKPIPDLVSNSRHWVAPHIAELLCKKNKKFDDMIEHEDNMEAYYDKL